MVNVGMHLQLVPKRGQVLQAEIKVCMWHTQSAVD